MKVDVVIGAAFGDEGKGQATSYFCTKNSLNVRFNGGAQARHTVVREDGLRTTFHHIGSGTIKGATTYLDKEFIVNPMALIEEIDKHLEEGIMIPKIYIHKDCSISTPYDSIVNIEHEIKRGRNRHGSCGLGIHETICRSKVDGLKISADSMFDSSIINDLAHIGGEWFTDRMMTLGLSEHLHKYCISNLADYTMSCLDHLYKYVEIVENDSIINEFHHIVMEGAQGLMLDEDHPYFPYVTHSKTGLHNVNKLLEDKHLESLHVHYVTRPYVTRHGAGPLNYELESWDFPEDISNSSNQFQGDLRYAHLDIQQLNEELHKDLDSYLIAYESSYEYDIFMTCLDHIENNVTFIDDGSYCTKTLDEYLDILADKLILPIKYTSNGPSYIDVIPR